jgi:RNA polymerase sigma-70 factor (ECF subfamily)
MDHQEFVTLYGQQFDRIYRYALALTGEFALAEDVAQEAFARLLRNGSGKAFVARPEAWLTRVARNLAVDSLRVRARDRPVPLQSYHPNPEQQLYQTEIQRRILSALARLAELQRECIAMREFAGLSYEEIAHIIGTSVDQVKVHLFRARRHLRKELEDLT